MIVPTEFRQQLDPSDFLLRALIYGWSWTTTVNADVSAGESINTRILNPSDSGRMCLIHFGDMSHEGEVTLTVYDDPTSVSGGSVADVNNNNIGVSRSTGMTVEENVTHSGGTVHHRQVHTGTGTVNIFDGYKIILQPGSEVVVEVTDQSAGQDELGTHMAYVETPDPDA